MKALAELSARADSGASMTPCTPRWTVSAESQPGGVVLWPAAAAEAADGPIVLAVDVGNFLRPDATTSNDRSFCHVYRRSDRITGQFVPGRPTSPTAPWRTRLTS
ncbi:hypothetical protein [Streptomyces sp. NRRL F-4474]|uniref:hypothetical protein n=1 Tax=Streptomyces sp. NRRL F-4474 TaxID=1463851 RepID=UPI0006897BD5|nr:hypothetical protein [Streptomyces sp. NRRL F-4474]